CVQGTHWPPYSF
nr:immunoglobulin light chain junction region [Macaca mulatta]MOV65263.1 immunoglobulin light chain junction region [Macaca mulatta]